MLEHLFVSLLAWAPAAASPISFADPGHPFQNAATQDPLEALIALKPEAARIRVGFLIENNPHASRTDAKALWDRSLAILGKTPGNIPLPKVTAEVLVELLEPRVECWVAGDQGLQAQAELLQLASADRPAVAAAATRLLTTWEDRFKPRPSEEEAVYQVVRQMAKEGNLGRIRQLGKRAVPALESMCRENPEVLPEVEEDPLIWILRVDAKPAAKFMLEMLEGSGPIWRARALRATFSEKVYWGEISNGESKGTAWKATRPGVWEPAWLDLVQRTLEYPDAQDEMLVQLSSWYRISGSPESLMKRVRELQLQGNRRDTLATRAVNVAYANPRTLPLILEGLKSQDPEVRRRISKRLAQVYDILPEVLALREDPDPELRLASLWTLMQRKFTTEEDWINLTGNTPTRPTEVQVQEAMAALWNDPNEKVRRATMSLLMENIDSVSEGLLRKIAGSSIPERSTLLGVQDFEPAQKLAAFAVLLEDPDPELRSSAGQAVINAFYDDRDTYQGLVESALDAIPEEERLAWIYTVARTEQGSALVTNWALAKGAPQELLPIRYGSNTWKKVLERLKSADVERWLPVCWRQEQERTRKTLLSFARDRASQRWLQATLRLSQDESLDLELRVLCAMFKDSSGVRSGTWAQLVQHPDWRMEWLEVSEIEKGLNLDWRDADGAVLSMSRSGAITPALLLAASEAGFREPTLAASARLIVDYGRTPEGLRTPSGEVEVGALRNATRGLQHALPGESPELDAQRLREALAMGLTRIQALHAIGKRRAAHHLPVLKESILAGEASSYFGVYVETLGRFLNDDAAELLLELAALAGTDQERTKALSQIEAIRTYQDARARWQQRKAGLAQRDEAVAEMLLLLADSDANLRREACRGLATLGAVEALPQLVRRLKDDDAGVRAAAQEALDRLNQAETDRD